jgi:beta-lactamase regulating signal transducer with metallopeptidase domain
MTFLLWWLGGILFRGTWLMAGALLAAAALQRRRPLAASSLLAAASAGLLALPLLASFLPGLPLPLGPAGDERVVESRSSEIMAALIRLAGSGKNPDPGSEVGTVAAAEGRLADAPESPRAEAAQLTSQAQAFESASDRAGPAMVQPKTAVQARPPVWIGLLLGAYCLGVLYFVARLAIGLGAVIRLRRNGISVSGDWADRLANWGPRIGATRSVGLLASEEIDIPMTVGWWKPVILFPTTMVATTSRDRDAVLLHELAHIRRRDFLNLLALQVVQALYWCHPLVWMLGRSARQLRERACDDLCIHWMGARETYRDVLLSIAGRTICRPRIALGLAMAHSSRLSQRVASIDQSPGNARCLPGMGVRLTVLVCVLATAALAALVQIVPRTALANPDREFDPPIAQKTDSLVEVAELPQELSVLPSVGQATPAILPGLDPSMLQQWSAARIQPSAKELLEAIDKAKQFLIKSQEPDGTWNGGGSGDTHTVGVTSLTLLALLNAGMSADDPEIQRGLGWLRQQQPQTTYEISLMIQALAAANGGKRDVLIVSRLAKDLEEMQARQGPNSGSWRYTRGNGGDGDRSNAQFAILGLREAQEMGVPVGADTWRKARSHWLTSQNPNGGWCYVGGPQPTLASGSMTVAGITSLIIIRDALQALEIKRNADGTPGESNDAEIEKALERAYHWLGNKFAVTNNPGDGRWVLYYLAGLARAGRFSGHRFFVNDRGQKHDWYREGTEYLIEVQNRFTGTWKEGDQNTLVGTSFALLFLSKGLAPVVINKLKFGPRDASKNVVASDWNRHPDDLRHLTKTLSDRPKWPRQLAWQTVDLAQATLADLRQAPILFFSGSEAPQFTLEELVLLKNYIAQGGSLFVDNCAGSESFDSGFRDLVGRMYPPAEVQVKLLPADHPVYRSEFNLVDEQTKAPTVELWGAEVDRRTSIIYSPHDLSSLWGKSTAFEIPERPKELTSLIDKGTRAGVNVVAYLIRQAAVDPVDRRK